MRGLAIKQTVLILLGVGGLLLSSGLTSVPAQASPRSPNNATAPAGVGRGRVIVLRPVRADLVDDGAVQRSVPLAGGPISLAALAEAIGDPSWIETTGTGVVLTSALLQRAGTVLDLSNTDLQLIDSATNPSSLSGSGATLRMRNAHISSTSPLLQPAAHGNVTYGQGSHVVLDGVTISGLGHAGPHGAAVGVSQDSALIVRRSTITNDMVGLSADSGSRLDVAGTSETGNRVGLAVGHGATLVARNDVIRGGVTGVSASNAAAVSLDGLTVRTSAGDGISIKGTRSVQLNALNVNGAGADGVRVVRATNAVLTNVVSAGNTSDGVRIAHAQSVGLTGLDTRGNGRGGVSIAASRTVTLSKISASGNVTRGITLVGGQSVSMTQVQSTDNGQAGIRLSQLPVASTFAQVSTARNAGGGTAVSASPQVHLSKLSSADDGVAGITVTDSTKATLDGVTVSGTSDGIVVRRSPATTVLDASVTRAKLALVIESDSEGSRVTGARVQTASVGIYLGSARVRVDQAVVRAAAVGILIASIPSSMVDHDTVVGANTGIQVSKGSSQTTVTQVGITQDGGTGLISTGLGLIATDVTVDGATTGLLLHGPATVSNSSVSSALEAVRVGSGATVLLQNDHLQATAVGIRSLNGAHVSVEGTHVWALFGTRGKVRLIGHANRLPALPLHWLGLFGVIAVVGALILELLRRARELGHPQLDFAPLYVRNVR